MLEKLQMYINGEWVESHSTETIEVMNPSDDSVLGIITAGNSDDVDKAVAAAKAAFVDFSFSTKEERVQILENIITEYEKRSEELAETISKEMGAPIWLSQVAQVASGLTHFKDTLNVLKGYDFEYEKDGYLLRKEPVGVVGMITPWNWPMNQMCTKVASGIAAGCTMVLKPSEITPFCGIILAEIIHDAGVPAGIFNLVNGMGPVVGASMSEHKDIDMMHFTGSTRAGVAVAQASAPTVKRVAQELGGKSANIVLDDADIEKAVSAGVSSCFLNTGQSCNAPTRMLVEKSIYKEAVERLKKYTENFEVGDPEKGGEHIGPVISETQYNKIQILIKKGIDEGAKLVAGGTGKPKGLEKGYYVKPTVFADVNNQMEIARTEIFGPVLSIIPFENEEEAISIANDTPYGLTNYIQTQDKEKVQRVARKLRSGMVDVNGVGIAVASPFGGYKHSGIGREAGTEGLIEFLEVKTVGGWN